MKMNIKINITPLLLTKLNMLSSNYDVEIGGYITGEIKDGEIYLYNLLIPKQTISKASVEIDSQGQLDLRNRYGDEVKKIVCHWHSHNSMGAFFSSIDEEDMKNVMEYRDFFIFIVSSRGEHIIRLYLKNPINFNTDDILLEPYDIELIKLKEEVEELINNQPIYYDKGGEEEDEDDKDDEDDKGDKDDEDDEEDEDENYNDEEEGKSVEYSYY